MAERRRRFERINFLASAVVIPLAGRPRFNAHVISLSRGGMGLFTEGFLEVGQEVEIDLNWTSPGGRIMGDRLKGEIAGSQIGIDGNTLGVKFANPLGPKHTVLLEYIRKAQQEEE